MSGYATKFSAGADCTSGETVVIAPHDVAKVPLAYYPPGSRILTLLTGAALNIPNGWSSEIRPRSSALMDKTLIVKSGGTIDSDYKGQVYAVVYNAGNVNLVIERGCKPFVQIVTTPIFMLAAFGQRDAERRGGFGSTDAPAEQSGAPIPHSEHVAKVLATLAAAECENLAEWCPSVAHLIDPECEELEVLPGVEMTADTPATKFQEKVLYCAAHLCDHYGADAKLLRWAKDVGKEEVDIEIAAGIGGCPAEYRMANPSTENEKSAQCNKDQPPSIDEVSLMCRINLLSGGY